MRRHVILRWWDPVREWRVHFNVTTWKTGVGQEPDFTHGGNNKPSQMVVNSLFKSSNGLPLHPRLRTGLWMHVEIWDSSRIPHDLAPTGFQLKLLFPKFQPQGLMLVPQAYRVSPTWRHSLCSMPQFWGRIHSSLGLNSNGIYTKKYSLTALSNQN